MVGEKREGPAGSLTGSLPLAGTPLSLSLFDYTRSMAENVRSEVLSPTALYYNEPEFLLRTELRNPARYTSILEAIATGHITLNEIAGLTGRRILERLAQHPKLGFTPSELADALEILRGSVGTTRSRLEERGLV
jgi:type IV secretory pathway ATPase VirB11/archaellum biosynthesis ATPase